MAEKTIREYIVRQTGELKAGAYENAPTTAIIVEEIQDLVRCRDCVHYNAGFECLKEGYGIEYPPDYYCADGERREECGE